MKKRIVMLCAALTVCVILCGCVSEGRNPADVSGSPEATAQGAPQTLEFEASYVRAAWDHSEQTPAAVVFNSRKELEDYYHSFSEESQSADSVEFLRAVPHYTDDFFKDHSLILTRVYAKNISDGYRVQSVLLGDQGVVQIEIDCFSSEPDEAEGEYRSIFIGTEKKISADAEIHAILTPNQSVQKLEFEARRSLRGGHEGGCEYAPALRVFRTAKELADHPEAAKQYSAAFFEEHTLVLIQMCEPISSSFQHEIQRVSFADGESVFIELDRFIPEVFSENEGHWDIWVEINMAISKNTPVEVIITDTKMEK